MRNRILVLVIAFILGSMLGPSALRSVQSAVPPIDWNTVWFVLVGSVLGMAFILGIQIARKNPTPARLGLYVFEAISVGIIGMGTSALSVSTEKYGWMPSGIFLAAIGVGALAGVILSTALFRWRYRDLL